MSLDEYAIAGVPFNLARKWIADGSPASTFSVSLRDEDDDSINRKEFLAAKDNGYSLSNAYIPTLIKVAGLGENEDPPAPKEIWAFSYVGRDHDLEEAAMFELMEMGPDHGPTHHRRWLRMVKIFVLLVAINEKYTMEKYEKNNRHYSYFYYGTLPLFKQADRSTKITLAEFHDWMFDWISNGSLERHLHLTSSKVLSPRPLAADKYVVVRKGSAVRLKAFPINLPEAVTRVSWQWSDAVTRNSSLANLRPDHNAEAFVKLSAYYNDNVVATGISKSTFIMVERFCKRCRRWLNQNEFDRVTCRWVYSLDGPRYEMRMPPPPLTGRPEWDKIRNDGKAHAYAGFPGGPRYAATLPRSGKEYGRESWEGRHDETDAAPDLPKEGDRGSIRVTFRELLDMEEKIENILEIYLK